MNAHSVLAAGGKTLFCLMASENLVTGGTYEKEKEKEKEKATVNRKSNAVVAYLFLIVEFEHRSCDGE